MSRNGYVGLANVLVLFSLHRRIPHCSVAVKILGAGGLVYADKIKEITCLICVTRAVISHTQSPTSMSLRTCDPKIASNIQER